MRAIRHSLLVSLGFSAASTGYFYSNAFGSIGIIILLIVWLISFKSWRPIKVTQRYSSVFLWLFFILLSFGLTFTLNFYQGQKEVIKFLPFIIFPLVFFTSPKLTFSQKIMIERIYCFSISILFLFLLIVAIRRQLAFSASGGIFNWYYFYRYDFLDVFKQHPTYLSMFTSLSTAILLFRKKLFNRSLKFLLVVIQSFAILLYGSRIGYLLLLIIIMFFSIKHFRKVLKPNKIKTIILSALVVVSLVVAAWSIPIIKERILYSFGYKYEYKFNDAEFIKEKSPEENGRLLLWQDAWEVIKEGPLIGYGVGSSREVLISKYKEKEHALFVKERFNAHNTYLELLIIGGIPLLLVYLLILSHLLVTAIRRNDNIIILFAIIITLTSITETIFLSQGIMFFSFFYCYLTSESD